MAKYDAGMAVAEGFGGTAGYKLVSDLGFTYIDKKLNRQNLPADQQIRTWLDLAVAVGTGAAIGLDMVPAHADSLLFGVGAAAVANTVEFAEKLGKVGPYKKTYTMVTPGQPAPFRQTPNYRPQQNTIY